jgi:hypothetical protein
MPLEQEMRAKAAAGELVDCGEGPFELAQMQAWGEEQAVRAAVLRHVLVEGQWPVAAKGIRLRGVRISGYLDLEAATLRCPLHLDSCYLDDGEPVCLDDATVPRLAITRCQLAGLRGRMLSAREVDLSGSALTGPLLIPRADITGQLDCGGARLTGQDDEGSALVASGVKVGGYVFFDRLIAVGAVRLSGADIAGQLNCRGAQLTGQNRDGNALIAERMKTGGHVLLDEGFAAAGAIRLASADIAGQLNCRGAQLTGRDDYGTALMGEGMKVGGHVLLDEGFAAAGTVLLRSARIGGSVAVGPSALAGQDRLGLDAPDAQITDTLTWRPAGQVLGQVNLAGASVGKLEDDWDRGRPNGFWPVDGRLHLDGFTYGRFGGDQRATVEQRLEWIRSQYHGDNQAIATQPYEQLAAVYRRAGQDSQARKVAIARRADLRKYGNLSPYRKAGNWLLDKTIKYGYQSWRAGVGLAAVFVIFAWLSVLAQQHHLIVPVGSFKGPAPSATNCTSSYPCFYPAGYAVDTVIPIINVHQADNWGPDGSAPWGRAFVAVTWIATALGWALATLLVAGYTGLVEYSSETDHRVRGFRSLGSEAA